MALEYINLGNRVNDGTGDNLRVALEKVNNNFQELSNIAGVTGRNLTNAGIPVFKQKVENELTFRTLVAGQKISLEDIGDAVRINSSQENTFSKLATDSSEIKSSDYETVLFPSTPNISVSSANNVFSIDTVVPVTNILTNLDFGPVTNPSNVIQLMLNLLPIDFNNTELNFDFGGV